MAINIIAESINSKRDRNGNTYWAFRLADARTGNVMKGKLGGSQRGALTHALSSMIRSLGWDWDNIHLVGTELPIREFNKLVKLWPYSHDVVKEVTAFAHGYQGSGKRRHPGLGVGVVAHRRRKAKVVSHKRHWPDVLPDTPRKKRRGGKQRAATGARLIAAAKAYRDALRGK
jgi:hypothetical protein